MMMTLRCASSSKAGNKGYSSMRMDDKGALNSCDNVICDMVSVAFSFSWIVSFFASDIEFTAAVML